MESVLKIHLYLLDSIHVVLKVDTIILEKHSASIFRLEVCRARNLLVSMQDCGKSRILLQIKFPFFEKKAKNCVALRSAVLLPQCLMIILYAEVHAV
jgi:hypothetical protein